jgi:hypothetical protein
MKTDCPEREYIEDLTEYAIREALTDHSKPLARLIQPFVEKAIRKMLEEIADEMVAFFDPFSDDPAVILLFAYDDMEWRLDINLDDLAAKFVDTIRRDCGPDGFFPDVDPHSILLCYAKKCSEIAGLLAQEAEREI